jgi:hypothetical protein
MEGATTIRAIVNELKTLNRTIEEIGVTTRKELKKKIEENKKKDAQINALESRQVRFVGRLKQLKAELNEFYKPNELCTTNIIPNNEVVAEEIDGGKKPKRKSKSRKTKARKSKSRKSKVYSIKKVFKNK